MSSRRSGGLVLRSVRVHREGRVLLRTRHGRRQDDGGGLCRQPDSPQVGRVLPARDIILALTADEEGGPENGVKWLLANHRALIDAEFAINEGGGGVMRKGRYVTNEVQAAEKVYQDLRLEVRNSGGHSSLPVKDNAIYRLSAGLSRLAAFEFPAQLNDITRAYFTRAAPATVGCADQGRHAARWRRSRWTPPRQRVCPRSPLISTRCSERPAWPPDSMAGTRRMRSRNWRRPSELPDTARCSGQRGRDATDEGPGGSGDSGLARGRGDSEQGSRPQRRRHDRDRDDREIDVSRSAGRAGDEHRCDRRPLSSQRRAFRRSAWTACSTTSTTSARMGATSVLASSSSSRTSSFSTG